MNNNKTYIVKYIVKDTHSYFCLYSIYFYS